MITDQEAKAVVAKRFTHGELSQVLSDGSILVRVGKSYTKLRSNEVQNTIMQMKHATTPIRLSDEQYQEIQEQKYGKPVEPKDTSGTPTPSAEQLHRQDVAKKYGL